MGTPATDRSPSDAPLSTLPWGPRRWVAAAVLAGAACWLLAVVPSCTLPKFGTGGLDETDAGATGECEEAADCPGLFLNCRAPSCDNTSCGTFIQAAGASCDDDGGAVCDGAGECVECLEPSHCQGGEICQHHLCVPATCGDGVHNAGETALDCGGPCAPCQNGQACDDGSDCVSGYCAGGTCAPCTITADCAETEWCDAGLCVPDKQDGDTCTDAEQCASGFCPAQDGACCNQTCDGLCMACIPGQTGLVLGQCGPVLRGDDFVNECPDEGASSCDSNGQGCNGSGACIFYDASTVCLAATCSNGERQLPDTCDGTGICDDGGIQTCSPYQCNGSVCRTTCVDDTHCLTGSFCDGTGHCVSQGGPGDPCGGDNQCSSTFCRDGRCCESACPGTCMACSNVKTGFPNGLCRSIPTNPIPNDPDNECASGACYRVDDTTGECRYNRGHSCDGSSESCLQHPCVDGYCCENNCDGLCESCDGADTVGGNGDCAAVTSDTDPDTECGPTPTASCGSNGDGCNGAGECILYPGGAECSAAICSGDDLELADLCNGSGVCQDSGTQDCSPYSCSGSACPSTCSGHTDCDPGYFCDGTSHCQTKGDVGDGCGGDVECKNDQCVDGFCCGDPCTGTCTSCDGAFNSGGNGVCSNVRAGEDPRGDCDYDCDGTGSCEPPDGTDCSGGSVTCGSGHCVDGFCCDAACDGVCEACRDDYTGAGDGNCAPIPNGQDPDEECPGIHVCLGNRTCS